MAAALKSAHDYGRVEAFGAGFAVAAHVTGGLAVSTQCSKAVVAVAAPWLPGEADHDGEPT